MSQIIFVIFILAICSINPNSAQLQCWRCDPCPEPHVNTSTLVTVETCTVNQTICVKNSVRVLNKSPQISKGCVKSCTPSSSNFFGQGAFVDCCNTNFCNLATKKQFSFFILFVYILYFYQ